MECDIRKYELFINGTWHRSTSGKRIDVINPATLTAVANVPDASAEDVEVAVKAARSALESGWAQESQQNRSKILRTIAQLIRERFEQLVSIEVSETGRPISEIRAIDILETADCFDYYAGAARLLKGETIPLDGPYLDYTLLEPVGVVAQIVPWNFPLILAGWKIAQALATGNCIVLKPSECTPSSVMELAKLAMEAGLPPGVLNVITGFGPTAGRALVVHPDVDMVAFTGGAAIGREIAETAGRLGKRVALELGGKSAQIIFADCDLPAAIASMLEGAFFAQGECCCASSRLLVERPILEDVISRLVQLTKRLRIGMPSDPETQIGCLISKRHFDRVMAYIEGARKEGGTVVVGGAPVKETKFDGKPFLQPTIVVEPPIESRIVQEEVFGPVLVVNGFDNIEEAIRLANATKYDLAAGIWTADICKAHRVAKRLRAGSVWINTYNRLFNDVPFGGFRWSGDSRDLGTQGLAQYTRVKNVCICHDPGSVKWFAL